MNSKRANILIVDDEEILCRLLAEELEDAGFQTFESFSGKQALEISASQRIDAMICDFKMPDFNGLEVLRKVRDFDQVSPVFIFVSGFAELTARDAYDEGAAAILSKPIDYDHLLSTLKRLLSSLEDRSIKKCDTLSCKTRINLAFESPQIAKEKSRLDIGRGGLSLRVSKDSVEVGDHIGFEIQFSLLSKYIKGIGICRWKVGVEDKNDYSDDCDAIIGLEILEFHEDSRAFFCQLLTENPTKSYIPALEHKNSHKS